jgi:hypothetical protein
MSDSGNPESSDRLLARVLGPNGPELSCEKCFAELDRYVELSLSGSGADRHLPGMKEHLDGCPACAEEYRSLREFVDAEG